MRLPDENGAHHATLGTDPANGMKYLIDLPNYNRLYQHPACEICGVVSWWSTPEPMPCGSCKRGRVARNQNEAA